MVKLQKVSRPNRYLFKAQTSSGKEVDVVGFEVVFNFNIKDVNMDVFRKAWQQVGLNPRYVGKVTKKGVISQTIQATTTALSNMKYKTIQVGKQSGDILVYKIFEANKFLNGNKIDATMEPYAYIQCNELKEEITTDNPKVETIINEFFTHYLTHYTNKDITRYLKTMIETESTLISLRSNGGVYIIPAKDHAYIEKMKALFDLIDPDGDFHVTELPDLDGAKGAMASGFNTNISALCNDIKTRFEKMEAEGTNITERVRSGIFQEIQEAGKELEMMMDITEYDLSSAKEELGKIAILTATFINGDEK